MRSKELLKNLRKALQQDYLYDSKELEFMREQLSVLEQEVEKRKKTKPQGFGKK
jgi:hypothetical protein|tara:strand:+ start:41 stop:202 length:162 start_codon:yes stop_codon:yes gene_type:complete